MDTLYPANHCKGGLASGANFSIGMHMELQNAINTWTLSNNLEYMRHCFMNPTLPLLSILGSWAIVLGTLEVQVALRLSSGNLPSRGRDARGTTSGQHESRYRRELLRMEIPYDVNMYSHNYHGHGLGL